MTRVKKRDCFQCRRADERERWKIAVQGVHAGIVHEDLAGEIVMRSVLAALVGDVTISIASTEEGVSCSDQCRAKRAGQYSSIRQEA